MISNSESMQIRQLLQSPQWGTFETMANVLCDRIKYDTVSAENQWEYVSKTLQNDGQILGIKRLLREAYNHAQNEQT